MNYQGVIIEESLNDKSILDDIKVVKTKVEAVTSEHQTPWLKQWTLHTVEISKDHSDTVTQKLSQSLDYTKGTSWYADFKNDQFAYIVFKDRVFKINIDDPSGFNEAREYGISLGIPEYQVDFAPEDKIWER